VFNQSKFYAAPPSAEITRGIDSRNRRSQFGGLTASVFEKAINNRIKFTAELVGTPEGRDGALLDAPVIVTKGLNALDVAAGTGGVTLTYMPHLIRRNYPSKIKHPIQNVPPQATGITASKLLISLEATFRK